MSTNPRPPREAGRPERGASRVRLVIVDDNQFARAGARSLLGGVPGLEVVGEAASGRAALALCDRLRPDLVLMDLQLGDIDGLAATRAIRRTLPATRVLLFSMAEAPHYRDRALGAGAAGYVLKGASRHELLRAIRGALARPPGPRTL